MSRREWIRGLGALGLILAVGFAALHTPFARARVLRWFFARLASNGLVCRADRLEYNLATLDIALYGMTLATASAPAEPFLSADVVRTRLGWGAYLGQFDFARVDVERPRVTVRTSGQTSPPPSVPPSVHLGDVHVRNFDVSWRDDRSTASVELRGISIDLLKSAGSSSGTIAMSTAGRIAWQDRTTSVQQLDGRLSWNGRDLSLDGVHVVCPEGELRADGSIAELLGSARVAMKVAGDVDLSTAGKWWPPGQPLAGRAQINAALGGELLAVDANVKVVGEDLAFRDLRSISLAATVEASSNRFSLTALTAQLAGGRVTLQGSTPVGDTHGVCRMDWFGISLPALVSALTTRPPAVLPGAHTTGSLEAHWATARLDDLRLRGRIQTMTDEKSRARHQGRLPLEGSATFALEKRRATVSFVEDIGTGARVRGELSATVHPDALAESTIGGRVTASSADIAQLARTLARAGIANLPEQTAGTLEIELAAGGTIGSPTFTGPLALADAQVGDARGVAGRARVTATRAAIRLDAVQATAGGNSAHGDVRFAVDAGRLDGRFRASLTDVGKLSTRLASVVPAGPALDLEGTIAGPIARPRVVAAVTSANLTVAGQTIDKLDADVTADGPDIAVRRLQIESGDGRLEAHGRVDLASRAYAIGATATRLPLRPIPESVGLGQVPLTATVNAQVDGEGSFDALGGRARLTVSEANWGTTRIGSVEGDVTAAGQIVSFRAGAADLGGNVTGDVNIAPGGTARLHGEWNIADAADAIGRLGWTPPVPVSGAMRFRFDLVGARDRLKESRVDVDLQQIDVSVNGRPVRLSHPSRITYDGQVLQARDLVLSANQSTLRIDGDVGGTGSSGLTAVLRGSLGDLPFSGIPPSGSMSVDVKASGPIREPEISGSWRLADGRLSLGERAALTRVSLSGRYEGGLITLDEARGELEGAQLTVTGQVPVAFFSDYIPADWRRLVPAAKGVTELSADIQGVTPEVLERFVSPGALGEVKGRIDVSARLGADRPAIDRVTGLVTLTRSELSVAGVSFDQQRPTRLRVHDGRVDVEDWEWGRDDHLVTVTGGATLERDPLLGIDVSSVLDLRALNAFIRPAAASGRLDSRIHVGSTASAPTLDGFATFAHGEIRLASPRVVVTDLAGTVTLANDGLTFERLWASVNGGETEITGVLRHRGWQALDGEVSLQTRGAAMDLSGLRAEADANLAWRVDATGSMVSGAVTLLRSSYREAVSLTGGLLKALQTSSRVEMPRPQSALDHVGLDIRIVTDEDLEVRNNYAHLAVNANLRLVGRIGQPGMLGRAVLADAGLVFFGGNRYRLADQGFVDFANPTRIEPSLDLKAVTRVRDIGGDKGDIEITLELKGTPATLQSSLTSDYPGLSQADLIALLVSGRTTTEAGGFLPGSTELLGYLSGELFDVAGRAVGLDTVRIERGTSNLTFDAGLVATETDPGARLTFGKTIRGNVQVVFSQSLRQTDALTWIVSYAPRSNLELRAVSLDNGERIYAFQHDVTIGGRPPPARPSIVPEPRIKEVQIVGTGADEAELRSRLKAQPGDRFDVFQWQDDRDRLEAFYHDRGRYEVRVTAQRTPEPTPADAPALTLVYTVRPGPQTTVLVSGFDLSEDSLAALRQSWSTSVGDEFLIEESSSIVRGELVDRGFLAASVDARIERPTADEKRLALAIVPGTRSRARRVVLRGNQHVSRKTLDRVIADARLERAVWVEPDRVRQAIEDFYRRQGYLDASARPQPIEKAEETATRTIDITEGTSFRIRQVRVEGVRESLAEVMRKALQLPAGMPFSEAAIERARASIDRAYRTQGFNNVSVTLRAERVPEPGAIDVHVSVEEGSPQRLRDVAIAGVQRTKPSLVSRALKLEIGQPVNLAEWNRARQRLYETGAFRRVDIEQEPIGDPATGKSSPQPEVPIRAKVTVEEWPPARFRYGLEVNDQPGSSSPGESFFAPVPDSDTGRIFGVGLASDIRVRNLFGRAVSAGVAGRITRDFKAARVYTTSPLFFSLPITSNVFVSRSREALGSREGGAKRFVTDITDLTVEQRIRPSARTELSYGYTFERNRTFDLNADPADLSAFDVTVNVGRLSSTFSLDARDDLVDATRGTFHSSAFEYGPTWLRSDVRFVKYVLQERYYRSVGPVVVATSGRFGLATAFDQTLLPSERFFAGGGNSVRGYDDDVLSPRDEFFNDPIGGNTMLVLNQEVRFPIVKILRGVGFVDAGRAFTTVGAIRVSDLSVGAGGGLRIQTPVALIRIDYGVPLDPRFAPRRGSLFVSIGQAF